MAGNIGDLKALPYNRGARVVLPLENSDECISKPSL